MFRLAASKIFFENCMKAPIVCTTVHYFNLCGCGQATFARFTAGGKYDWLNPNITADKFSVEGGLEEVLKQALFDIKYAWFDEHHYCDLFQPKLFAQNR
jgi:hypothetical protein